ncbi:MAG TPA: hypothetical protein VG942_17480 [Hyphomonadaceae bacterium]|nr:hypothetical protein [Hyphomonadaceae bacterium]
MSEAIWTKHLEPGERLVWQAGASARLLRADASRRRLAAGLMLLASLGLAAAFGWKLYESAFPDGGGFTMAAGFAIPLYFVLALTFLAVAVGQVQRIARKAPPPRQYALTDHRLIALDAAGKLVDQVDRQEIAGLILGGRRAAPDLFVLRNHDDTNVRAFSIEHIDKPVEAKAIIEQTFSELAEPAP